ncbi:Mor transcription activator family protein [Variovorax sp. CY25R-8]|uniref:Mor transcription activator family protein n=1 Tax=Variovorax sp. CY25R-8 TaxID=2855501 RepID=UPI0039647CEC
MAKCFGVTAPDQAAASLVDRIMLRLGGAHIYVPRRTTRERLRTYGEIANRFNGSNLFELAREYGMTPRHLRRIIAAQKIRKISQG